MTLNYLPSTYLLGGNEGGDGDAVHSRFNGGYLSGGATTEGVDLMPWFTPGEAWEFDVHIDFDGSYDAELRLLNNYTNDDSDFNTLFKRRVGFSETIRLKFVLTASMLDSPPTYPELVLENHDSSGFDWDATVNGVRLRRPSRTIQVTGKAYESFD